MEPIGEGRPLLTLQDLEARMVFTKCKPFQLAAHGRQWIFGELNHFAHSLVISKRLNCRRRFIASGGTISETVLDAVV